MKNKINFLLVCTVMLFSTCKNHAREDVIMSSNDLIVVHDDYLYYISTLKDSIKQQYLLDQWHQSSTIDPVFNNQCKLYQFFKQLQIDTLTQYIHKLTHLEEAFYGKPEGVLREWYFKNKVDVKEYTAHELNLYARLRKRTIQYQYLQLPSGFKEKSISEERFDQLYEQYKGNQSVCGTVLNWWPKYILEFKLLPILDTLKLNELSRIVNEGENRYVYKIINEEKNKRALDDLEETQLIEIIEENRFNEEYQEYLSHQISKANIVLNQVTLDKTISIIRTCENKANLSCKRHLSKIGKDTVATFQFNGLLHSITLWELMAQFPEWQLKHTYLKRESLINTLNKILQHRILYLFADGLSILPSEEEQTSELKIKKLFLFPNTVLKHLVEAEIADNPNILISYYEKNKNKYTGAEQTDIAYLYFKTIHHAHKAYSKNKDRLFQDNSLKPVGLVDKLVFTTIKEDNQMFSSKFRGGVFSAPMGRIKVFMDEEKGALCFLKVSKHYGKRALRFEEVENRVMQDYTNKREMEISSQMIEAAISL